MVESTIPKLAALHFWPACPKADCTKSFTALSISALAEINKEFLPLVSAIKFKSGFQDKNSSAVASAPVRIKPAIPG